MNILIISNKSPWPPKEGGPIAINMIIEGLMNEGHQVKVLAVNSFKYDINPEDIPQEYKENTGIELIDVDLRLKPLPAFLNLFTGKSYHVERFISKAFRKRLIEILKADDYDIVQFETIFVAPYLKTVRDYTNAKVVLRAHNIEHLIWSRVAETTQNPLKRLYIRHLANTLKKYEHQVINQVDGIAAITEKDAEYFREVQGSRLKVQDSRFKTQSSSIEHPTSSIQHPETEIENRKSEIENRIIAIPFGIDLDKNPAPKAYDGPPSLFSIGAMNWIPNAEGIKWFLHHVWPDLHKEFPDLKYYLAGREMPTWMTRMKMPGVVVVGEVNDAREFMDSHEIMIVPLFSGSGIRIKIIEGMAAGKAIVSTGIGAEGIDFTNGKNILIANAACEFIDLISMCVADEKRTQKLGNQARELIETTYDQRLIIRKLITFYQQLTG